MTTKHHHHHHHNSNIVFEDGQNSIGKRFLTNRSDLVLLIYIEILRFCLGLLKRHWFIDF